MSRDGHEHEVGIGKFLRPNRKERWRELISQPRKRAKLVAGLAHFGDIDDRWRVGVDSANASAVHERLVLMGAPEACYIMSENPVLDQQGMDLDDALEAVFGMGYGTIVSCLPGRLAFIETEDERCILQCRS